MKQQISYKNFFINYAIFVLIAAFVTGILIYIIKVSQSSWDKNLKASVEYTLGENEPDTWEIGKAIRINNPLTDAAAAFEARNKKSGENCKAIIIRIQTFYGPQSGVYIIDSNKNVTFKGFSSVHGRCANQLVSSHNGRRVEYWKMRISGLLND